MKSILPLFLIVVLASCGTGRNVYKSSEFSNVTARHRTVAILPVQIIQTGHVGKKESLESIKANNEKLGYSFQESLHSYILMHSGKRKKSPIVNFQAIQKTNALLSEANISIDDAYKMQPEELAALLKVDAVIITSLQHDKNFSDGVAYGLAAGRAVLTAISGPTAAGARSAMAQNASDITMNSYLYNGKDSKLLWKTFRKGGTDLPSDVDGVVRYYSNWIAKKLPYGS